MNKFREMRRKRQKTVQLVYAAFCHFAFTTKNLCHATNIFRRTVVSFWFSIPMSIEGETR